MNKSLVGLFVLCVLVAVCAGEGQCKHMHPVVLIPGVMGTVLHANANIPSNGFVPNGCPRQFSDQTLWIDLLQLIDYKCLQYYFSSDYVPEKKSWVGLQGLDFIIPKLPSTYSCDILAPSNFSQGFVVYYHDMIEKLESIGYKDGDNLIGGSFDWTKLPTKEWLDYLKNIIEDRVKKSGEKAVLIAHSMGGPYSYYFLMKMGKEWVAKHIHMYIPMAPAWMGAPKALDMMLEGLDRDIPLAGKQFAPLFRHLPCVWFLLPKKDAFKGKILAKSPNKTYTFDQLEELLNDGNASYVEGKLAATQGLFDKVIKEYDTVPNVPVRAFIGYGKGTVFTFKFHGDIKPHDPDGTWETCTRINSDGDGTLPVESSMYATEKWKDKGDVKVFMYHNVGHLPIIKDSTVINDVISQFCD